MRETKVSAEGGGGGLQSKEKSVNNMQCEEESMCSKTRAHSRWGAIVNLHAFEKQK